MSTRLRIIWLTLPSETPSQVARCSRGIMGWSVMRSSVRFSDGLTPKAGAACAMRSGSGIDARFRSGDWVRVFVPPGLLRETTPFSEKNGLPITNDVQRQTAAVLALQRVPGLHGNVAVVDVPVVAEPRRQPLLPHAGHQG